MLYELFSEVFNILVYMGIIWMLISFGIIILVTYKCIKDAKEEFSYQAKKKETE